MSVLGIIKRIAKPLIDLGDKAITDKDLRQQYQNQVDMAILTMAEEYEKEISKRHELDMQSDSWLSKNIRPMTLAFLMFVFVIITFFDGNVGRFSLNEAYIPVYETFLTLVFTFYFGGRSIEKATKIYKNGGKE